MVINMYQLVYQAIVQKMDYLLSIYFSVARQQWTHGIHVC